MMKVKIILTVLFILLLNFTNVFATLQEAVDEADQNSSSLKSKGYNIRYDDYDKGALNVGESYTYSTTFYAGNSYALVASGCSTAKDVDVYVYDAKGALVINDNTASKTAIVYFTPKVTGTYYIKIKMYAATDTYAHWCAEYGTKN